MVVTTNDYVHMYRLFTEDTKLLVFYSIIGLHLDLPTFLLDSNFRCFYA